MRRAALLLVLVALLSACSGDESTPTVTPGKPADQATPGAKPGVKVVTELEARATPTPATPTPVFLPPTSTPRPYARLELLSHRTYSDPIGSVWVVGEAKNTGEAVASDVEVTVSLLDAERKSLTTTYATLHLAEVAPQAKTPFRAMFAQPPPGWKDVRVNLTAAPVRPLDDSPYVADLKVAKADLKPSVGPGGAVIAGEVKNEGKKTALMVQVIAVLRGPDGEVMDVVDGYAQLPELASGASSPFSVQFTDAKKAGPFEVFVQGRAKPSTDQPTR